jgi:hypothetical protein
MKGSDSPGGRNTVNPLQQEPQFQDLYNSSTKSRTMSFTNDTQQPNDFYQVSEITRNVPRIQSTRSPPRSPSATRKQSQNLSGVLLPDGLEPYTPATQVRTQRQPHKERPDGERVKRGYASADPQKRAENLTVTEYIILANNTCKDTCFAKETNIQ